METTLGERHAHRTSTWEEAAAGVLPVSVLSLATTLEGTSQNGLTGILVYVFILLLFALPAVGIPLAWECGFQRWSSSYLAIAALDVLLLPSILFSQLFPSFWGNLFLQMTTVLLVIVTVYRLMARMRNKARRTSYQADNDWTQILFGAQTLTPVMIMGIFDEIAVPHKTPWILASRLILAAGALVYLRSRRIWLGTALLITSALLAVLLANFTADLYWSSFSGG
jgi:hypothetical protein